MSNAAIYARVSSARQKKDETIGSQTAALRAHAEQLGLDVPEQWVFEDDGPFRGDAWSARRWSGCATWSPGSRWTCVLCYSPDRLARKFAYQALLIEEFARAGTRVEFVKGPRGDSPEDQLLVQFQGMFAEYEKAQIMERYPPRQGPPRQDRHRSTCSPAPRSATGTSARPSTPTPRYEIVRARGGDRRRAVPPLRRRRAPRSPTWPAG